MARVLPLHHPYRATTVRASSSNETKYDGVAPEVKLADPTRNYRVLVLGGTGRVGESTAVALSKLCPKLKIVVAGRNREKGEAMVAKLGENSEFCQVDINDANMLQTSLKDVDLVVHAAGPFQQAPKCTVLEAAIKTKVRIRLLI